MDLGIYETDLVNELNDQLVKWQESSVEYDSETIVKFLLKNLREKLPSGGMRSVKKKSGYHSMSSYFKVDAPAHKDELFTKVGEVTLSRDSKYAPKTAEKVKEFDEDVFKSYASLDEAYDTVKGMSLAGFSLPAFLWANLSDEQRGYVNEAAGSMEVSEKKSKSRSGSRSGSGRGRGRGSSSSPKTKRKGGHNCIKTISGAALQLKSDDEDNHDLMSNLKKLRKLDRYEGKDKGLQFGNVLWHDIKDVSPELVEKWHNIDESLPKKPASLRKEAAMESQYLMLLNETAEFVLGRE